MPTQKTTKITTNYSDLVLRASKGHFVSSHSHSNYYIDVAAQKSRLSEAKAVAKELCRNYNYNTKIVDTILCLDGTEVIGTCLADFGINEVYDLVNFVADLTAPLDCILGNRSC